MRFSGVILDTILVLVLVMPTSNIVGVLGQSLWAIPASMRSEQMLSDPELGQALDVVVNGTLPEEFSWTHEALPDDGIVELNWTHTAGTAIHVRSPPDADLPDSLDFIYFQQSFDWTETSMPSRVALTLNRSVSCTGSFNSTAGGLMFRVYAWLVNRLGIWTEIYVSTPSYSLPFIEDRRDLNLPTRMAAFKGPGVVALAVGLSPVSAFISYDGTEPWKTWNGSVSASFSDLKLDVLVEEETPPSERIEPLFNVSYGFNLREVFPDIPEDEMYPSDEFTEMATDDLGMIYMLVNVDSSYDYYVETGRVYQSQTILKCDPRLGLVWRAKGINMTHGYDIEVRDGFLYTAGRIMNPAGYYDLYVSKWTLDGARVWDATWDSGQDDIGGAIAVAANGSVYVFAEKRYLIPYSPEESTILKFSSSGERLWDRTGGPSLEARYLDMEIVDGHLVVCTGSAVQRLNSSCLPEYSVAANALAVDQTGNVYTCLCDQGSGWFSLFRKMDVSGNELWSCAFAIIYSDIWSEELRPESLVPLDNGSLVAVLSGLGPAKDYYFVTLSPDGEYLEHKYVADADTGSYHWRQGVLSVCLAETGLVYLGCNVFPAGGSRDTGLLAYIVGPYELPPPSLGLNPVIIVGAGAGVAAVAAVVWYFRKNKMQDSPLK